MEIQVLTKLGACEYDAIAYAYIGDTIEVESEKSETGKIIHQEYKSNIHDDPELLID